MLKQVFLNRAKLILLHNISIMKQQNYFLIFYDCQMKEFIEYIAKQLVDHPEKVNVEESKPDENSIELLITVEKSDLGKIIGKKGNTINAMRTLLIALGGKEHHRVSLNISDSIDKAK